MRRDHFELSTTFKVHNNLVPFYLKDITHYEKPQNDFKKPLKYFFFGKRFLNIIHAKLRHNCLLKKCILKYYLYRCYMIAEPMC